MKSVEGLSQVEDGFLRDYLMRVQFAKDIGWWDKSNSPWRLTECHENWEATDYNPDFWRDRVTRLCAFDITMSNFGLSYNDLMQLDVPTFEYIEKKVHELAKARNDALPKDMKEGDKNK